MLEVSSGGGVARYHALSSGVVHVTATGVVTIQGISAMHAERQRRVPGTPAAVVCDFSVAVLAFSARDLHNWLRDQGSAQRPVPTGFVVNDEQLAMFLEHASAAASEGINRQIFLDLPTALSWAAGHAVRRQSTSSLGRRTGR